jgi:hypothetical protein
MSDVGVNDSEVPRLTISPADGTTQVTLVLRGPDGSATPVTVAEAIGSGDGQTWEGQPVTYTAPGRWILDWTVTGTGAGSEQQEVFVAKSPLAGGPTWWPTRSNVASYIPSRTLARNPAAFSEAGDEHAFTFDATTNPTGLVVDSLIADQAAWVTTRIPKLTEAGEATARTVTAMFTAAAIERGWPDNDSTSLQRATDLERRASGILDDLLRATDEETGEQGDGSVLPVWSFPAPVRHGDDLI